MRTALIFIAILAVTLPVFADVVECPTAQDTYISQAQPDYVWGTADFLHHGLLTTGGLYRYLMIQFDLSSIPAGATINGATMSVYNYAFDGTPNGTIVYYIITASWDEATATWNNQPSYSSAVETSSGWPGIDTWHNVDVTNFVQNWWDGSYDNYGIYWGTAGTTDACLCTFHSHEYSDSNYRPYLTVDYTNVSVQPTSLGNIKAMFK